jgi:hypothetical protein
MTRKRLALVLLCLALAMGLRAARVAHADGLLLQLMSAR